MRSFALLVFYFIFAFASAQSGSPGKPRNVKVEAVRGILQVTWEAPLKSNWNGEIRGYYINSTESDSDDYKIEYSYCTMETCSSYLFDLKANTKYSIGVIAFDAERPIGSTSDLVEYNTPEGQPDAPGDIMCTTISSKEIRVSWQSLSPESLHGTLKHYNVTYALGHLFDDGEKREYKTTMGNETILNGLKKNANYAINVFATTGGGDGLSSQIVQCSTEEDVPDEPVDVKVVVYGTQKVLMLWHEPLETNGDILHYTIYYQKPRNEMTMENVLPSRNSYDIIGLEANETYEFWVSATSKIGEGLTSKHLVAIPSTQTPAKIAALNGTVTVNYRENATLSCDAVGLPAPEVIWKVNGDNLIPNERFRISAEGTLIIQSVIREDANNYTCFAGNAHGNDSVTHELFVKAPPKAPEVTILSITTDEIILRLKRNQTDSAIINEFKLFYKFDSKIEKWLEVHADFQKHTYQIGVKEIGAEPQTYRISRLKCGSSYRIFAYAYNDLGSGDPFETVIRTNGSKPIAPPTSNFIEPHAEGVTLHLSSWKADSCPISHFFVEYKEKANIDWVKIRDKLKPDSDFVLNLESGKVFNIRVTAHNSAGPTVAYYEVATLP